uniref:Uncharacterized protein n=1 Tax=Arundo donax TaxID=35708 RepID=A0A0A9EKV9_ARUDO
MQIIHLWLLENYSDLLQYKTPKRA